MAVFSIIQLVKPISKDIPPVTDCISELVRLPSCCNGRLVKASSSSGAITSDGDAVLLRQADLMTGLHERAVCGANPRLA